MSLIGAMLKTYKANNMDKNKLKKLQDKRLKKIVKYARENSAYFNELYKGIGDNFKIEDLPVTNKIDMMKYFDDWVTDKNINMQRIEEYTKNIDNVGKMIDNKYLIFKTSGSTGNPATILYDTKDAWGLGAKARQERS